MTLCISNIAWSAEEEAVVADELVRLRIESLEVAPTRVFPDAEAVSREDARRYKSFWLDRGIRIAAFQSMLFDRPDAMIFGSADQRAATLAVLRRYIELAGVMEVGVLVFGSPKNRRVPPEMSQESAHHIAVDFFAELAEVAEKNGAVFCIEPNPPQYECNFIWTAEQGRALVDEVARVGFGLHLDVAGMTLAGENVFTSIVAASPIRHFHISAPQLGAIEEEVVDHPRAAAALAAIEYQGKLSIEMRPGDGTLDRLRHAVELARQHYRPLLAAPDGRLP